jgi:hypothetical protein
MFYKCFVFIKEVAGNHLMSFIIKEVAGNHLMSFIIKEVYYLAIIKPNIVDLRPSLIN